MACLGLQSGKVAIQLGLVAHGRQLSVIAILVFCIFFAHCVRLWWMVSHPARLLFGDDDATHSICIGELVGREKRSSQ